MTQKYAKFHDVWFATETFGRDRNGRHTETSGKTKEGFLLT